MLFNSIEFLFIFLPIVFIVNCLLIKFKYIKFSNLWLLISSLYFYAYYKIEYLPIIIFSIIFNYSISYFMQKKVCSAYSKYFVIFAVIGNLLLLSYYKYFNNVIELLNNFSFINFNFMELCLPLGISFFTFQQIGYITDLHKKEAEHTNFIDYTLFVTFFPQLIAGPICTFKELIPQLKNETLKCIKRENIYAGFFLITIGLFKKVILADNFSDFVINTINLEAMIEFYTSWTWSLAIAIRGYFDFSGYCDMALGIALLFNITLPINFDSPYKSIDISEFWRRWHITMGRFLKYNVYIPMGGSRKGELRAYFNLFFVFFVTGLWHGANLPCILFGVINGIIVSLNKLWKKTKIQMNKTLAIFITFITLVYITPLVVIKDINHFYLSAKTMIGIGCKFIPITFKNLDLIFFNPELKMNIILLISSLIIIFCCKNSNELVWKFVKSNNVLYVLIVLIVFIISVLSITKGSEFIYFEF